MERVAIGLLGLGTVGSGVVRLLAEANDRIVRRSGQHIEVKWAVVRDLALPRIAGLAPERIVTDPRRVVYDPDVSIVVEAMGGTDPTLRLVLDALAAGRTS